VAAIIDYRDEVLSLAESDVLDHRDRARLLLGVVALAAMLLTGALLAAGTVFRRRFVQPFVEATTVIKEIAEGEFSTPVPQASNRDEILGLFSAIAVLKANSIAKLSLERERDVLIRDLEIMADTDLLTRMLNRRAFLRKAHIALREARVDGATPALIMLNIDHFKEINDTYGHAAGDHALQVACQSVPELCRPADILRELEARNCFVHPRERRPQRGRDRESASAGIAGTAVTPTDLTFAMTASFGVAVPSDPSSRTTVDELLKRADRVPLLGQKRAGRKPR